MKEKKFARSLALQFVFLMLVYLAANIVLKAVLDDKLTVILSGLDQPADQYTVSLDDSGLISVDDMQGVNGSLCLTFSPTYKGSGTVWLEVLDSSTRSTADYLELRVTPDYTIVNTSTGNFSHYRERQLCITLLCLAFSIVLWAAFFRSCRELVFSYQSIFCVGMGLWSTLVSILMLVSYLQNIEMVNLYNRLADAPVYFAYYSFPLMLLFSVLLTTSNISLIRHEGFRSRNALGILLSAVIVLGFILLQWIYGLDLSGSELEVKLCETAIGLLSCIYAVMECFLQGAVVCGTRAANHQPAFDKDYIIILGCMICRDGTLYPLIRGRVDRAIRFYKDQLTATGKKAVFIPSGGQGRNEPISEAAAMKRYLMERGFTEEQILPEDHSRNTRQNMEFSHKLMMPGTKATFSTTNYHVFRSGIISRQAGFEPEGMGSTTKWYFWPNAYVREVIGMLSYKWKSLIVILIPIAAFLTVLRFIF